MNRISLILGVGVFSISLAAPLFKLSAPTHPLVASAFRLTVAGVLWFIWLLYTQKPSKIQKRHMIRVGLMGAFCYAVHFGSWQILVEVHPALATLCSRVGPIQGCPHRDQTPVLLSGSCCYA